MHQLAAFEGISEAQLPHLCPGFNITFIGAAAMDSLRKITYFLNVTVHKHVA